MGSGELAISVDLLRCDSVGFEEKDRSLPMESHFMKSLVLVAIIRLQTKLELAMVA